jgi:hypothetical protein
MGSTSDYDPMASPLPAPESLGLEQFAERAFQALAAGGANGAAFIDLALTEASMPLVVECKDFVNGSVTHPGVLADALRAWSG